MIEVNALGDSCPIPVVKTKNAIRELNGSGTVSTLVDNEIAVQNLMKMAGQKGYEARSEKLAPRKYRVIMTVGEPGPETDTVADSEEYLSCPAGPKNRTVVAISSETMGRGSDELGRLLMKGFLFALSQQETLPKTILFYNGGARLTCEDSPSLEDIRYMASQGVEILTCGTCLNHYGLESLLKVGEITNMYSIVEIMTQADLLISP